MFKSITELCDLDSSSQKQFQSQQNLENKSNISYNGFFKSDSKQKIHLTNKHPKLIRSQNISPSVGQYDVSYKGLDSHRFEVNFSSPRRLVKLQEQIPQTIRSIPVARQFKQNNIKGGTDFEKQVSREQMYQFRGWLKFDKSMRTPKRTLEEKLRQLEVGQDAVFKFPIIDVKENPQLQLKISQIPHDYDKMKQISRQFLQKYHIKESALRFYSP